jgi:hypothetical protein
VRPILGDYREEWICSPAAIPQMWYAPVAVQVVDISEMLAIMAIPQLDLNTMRYKMCNM